MYRYQIDGLEVLLASGFEEVQTKYGDSVRFRDLAGLSVAIAVALLKSPGRLTRNEFRYLRRTSNLSQASLGERLGVGDQTVSLWERNDNRVPLLADAALRLIAAETLGVTDFSMQDVLRLASLETSTARDFVFGYGGAWQEVRSNIAVHHVTLRPAIVALDREVATRPFVTDMGPMFYQSRTQTQTVRYQAHALPTQGPYALVECA